MLSFWNTHKQESMLFITEQWKYAEEYKNDKNIFGTRKEKILLIQNIYMSIYIFVFFLLGIIS